MNKLFLLLSLLFISIFLFESSINANEHKFLSNNEKEEVVKKNHESSVKQQKIKKELNIYLSKLGLTKEDIYKEGGFYFTEDDGIVLQLKKNSQDKIKHKKLEESLRNAAYSSNTKFEVQSVNYSRIELEAIVESWYDVNSDLDFTVNTFIIYNYLSNQVELKTDKIDIEDQETLLRRYGDKIQIIIDPTYEVNLVDTKSRRADWNKLGSGIGIVNSSGEACSTAGVVRKDTRYFILTAGHCVESIGDNVRQYYSDVGTAHLDAQSIKYDFGLVLVNRGNLTRYAFNGLYLNDANNPSDYDGRLRNVDKVEGGETICKSGIKTGYTCGEVTSTSANYDGEINFEVRNLDEFMAGSGDSGSAGFRSANGYLIGIQSKIEPVYRLGYDIYGYKAYFTPVKPMLDKYNLILYTSDTPTRILN